jgi:hypothetical protein
MLLSIYKVCASYYALAWNSPECRKLHLLPSVEYGTFCGVEQKIHCKERATGVVTRLFFSSQTMLLLLKMLHRSVSRVQNESSNTGVPTLVYLARMSGTLFREIAVTLTLMHRSFVTPPEVTLREAYSIKEWKPNNPQNQTRTPPIDKSLPGAPT